MIYHFGPYLLDPRQRALRREGELVSLAPKTIDLLILLVERSDRIVTRDEISETVWQGVFIDDSSISKNISILRRELRSSLGDTDPIRTVSKRGYQFVYPISSREEGTAEGAFPDAEINVPVASFEKEPAEGNVPAPAIEPPSRSRRAWALPLLGVVVLTGLGSAGVQRWQAKRHSSGRSCLVVLDFKNLANDPESDWLATALPEAVRLNVQRNGDIRFISSDRVAQTERELDLSGTTAYTPKALQSLQSELGCSTILSGSYLEADAHLRVDVELQDATSGAVVGKFTQTDLKDDFLQIAENAAASVRQQLKLPVVKAADKAAQASLGTEDGMRLYAEGLRLLHAGKVPEAQVLLSQAEQAAPNSAEIHVALAQVWSQMGFDAKAGDEANLAVRHSDTLPREQKLLAQAEFSALSSQHSAAAATYTTLVHDFPDVVEYSLGLARELTRSNRSKDAIAAVDAAGQHHATNRNDPRLAIAKAEAYKATNDYRGQLVAAGNAIQLAHVRSARFLEGRALLLEGTAWMKLGNPGQARDDFSLAEKVSEGLQDNAGLGEALTNQGELAMQTESADPEPLLRRALDIERGIGSRHGMFSALLDLASHSRSQANMFAARELYLQALTIAQEVQDRTGEANALLSLGNVSLNTGDPDGAMQSYTQAKDIAQAIHNHRMEAIAMGNVARVQFVQGDLNGSRKLQQQVLAMKQQIGDVSSIAVTLDYLTTLEIAAGNLKQARDYADEQTKVLHASGNELLRDQINYCILAIEEGNPAYAESPMTQLAAVSPKPSPGAEALRVLALSWFTRGQLAEAKTASERNIALARTSPNVADYLIPAAIVAARIDAAQGHAETAMTSLESLLRDAKRIQNVSLQLEIRLALGGIEFEMGRSVQGRNDLASLQNDASEKGFGLIANKARTALLTKH